MPSWPTRTPAESAALLQYFGNKLFYMHFNDNWRLWDDDMTVGSVHTIETLELLYWLDRMNYTGWYALDIFPYRENGISAATRASSGSRGCTGCSTRSVGSVSLRPSPRAMRWRPRRWSGKRCWGDAMTNDTFCLHPENPHYFLYRSSRTAS